MAKRTEQQIMHDIIDRYIDLSPESLSHDGERPASEVRRAEGELQEKLNNLFAELGCEVSELEACKWERDHRTPSGAS